MRRETLNACFLCGYGDSNPHTKSTRPEKGNATSTKDLSREHCGNDGACSKCTVEFKFTVMILHGVFDDGKAKTGATGLLGMAFVHPVKAFKDLFLMLGSDTDPCVLYPQTNRMTLF